NHTVTGPVVTRPCGVDRDSVLTRAAQHHVADRVRIGGVTDQADRGELESRLAELAERETAYGLLQRAQAMLKRRHYAQAAVLLERAAPLGPGHSLTAQT